MTAKINQYDVIIIGAGAAGLMCAIEAGKRGKSVCIIEHANKPGKKILMSGGGRCNFTNLQVTPQNYLSCNPHFCKSALGRYSSEDFIALVKKHSISFHEKTKGQLFCDNKSKDILNMLLAECDQVSVQILLRVSVDSVKQLDGGFSIKTTQGIFQSHSLVIATGGLSIPTMGATGFGYEIAKQFGLPVYPVRAALVPFTLQPQDKEKYATLSGISIDCRVSCKKQIFEDALLFTHRGLSGPAMLQISSYWQPGEELLIDCLPNMDLADLLKQEKTAAPKKTLRRFLTQYLTKAMVNVWLSSEMLEKQLAGLSYKECDRVAGIFHQWRIKPNGTEGYRTAEVTLGGVDCRSVCSKTFEAQDVKGLYFIGEVLDVTGWLGGYNFQWAWASGAAAGKAV